ncbi:MAG: hypothetical protein ACXWP0_01080 [Ktedonobacterales bacterium]
MSRITFEHLHTKGIVASDILYKDEAHSLGGYLAEVAAHSIFNMYVVLGEVEKYADMRKLVTVADLELRFAHNSLLRATVHFVSDAARKAFDDEFQHVFGAAIFMAYAAHFAKLAQEEGN